MLLFSLFGKKLTVVFEFETVLRAKTNVENDLVLREADTESDCLADRAAALDEQKVNNKLIHMDFCAFHISHTYFACFFFVVHRMERKHGMYPNVHQMVAISVFSAIVPLDIVGACTKTLEKIFRARR